ncbi:MAG: hybrid sensor histidine kinase/response regulator [Acidobacteriota bacterium]
MTPELLRMLRDELRRQLGVIAPRLPPRGGPGSAGPDRSLSAAVSSLRSAASVIGPGPLDEATGALEGCLSPAESGAAVLDAAEVEALHRVIAALERLAAAEDLGTALRERGKEIRQLAATLAGLREAKGQHPGPAAGRVDGTLELFRLECEIHTATLGDGLLLLERQPQSMDVIERLMRAAHSLKGAARVVGLDAPVKLAHAMEDYLVRAQRGEVPIDGGGIDALLAGTDALARAGQAPGTDAERLLALAERVRRLGAAKVDAIEAAPTMEVARALEPSAGEPAPAGEEDRVLRVKASHVTKLVGLAGESLVEARRLQPFASVQHRLRVRQASLSDLVNDIHQALGAPPGDDPIGVRIAELRARVLECRELLSSWVEQFEEHTSLSEDLTLRLYQEASASRMRPFADSLQPFPRMIRDLARKLGKGVDLRVSGEGLAVDRDVSEALEAPLTHLLRNAVDHGIEAPGERRARGKPERGTITVDVQSRTGMVAITIADDGRGLDAGSIRARAVKLGLVREEDAARLSTEDVYELLFAPGFSTAESVTELSGRGVGLDVVLSTLSGLGGSAHVTSEPGAGTTFHLAVASSRQVIRAVVVRIGGEPYAFPLGRIDRLVRVPIDEARVVEDRQYVLVDDRSVALVPTAHVLELGGRAEAGDVLHLIVVSDRSHRFGLLVDGFMGEHDLVVRRLDPRLGRVSDISAAATLADGAPVLIVDVDDLIRSILRLGSVARIEKVSGRAAGPRRKRVLVVDDSITVRELERQLLANRGFDVEVAVDGVSAWGLVRDTPFDLVITDVDMPRMDGVALTRSIKQDPRLRDVPVIMVSYRDSPGDRARGLEAKADFYIAKSEFQDEALLQAVADLVGDAVA